jgi:hypothetical protein
VPLYKKSQWFLMSSHSSPFGLSRWYNTLTHLLTHLFGGTELHGLISLTIGHCLVLHGPNVPLVLLQSLLHVVTSRLLAAEIVVCLYIFSFPTLPPEQKIKRGCCFVTVSIDPTCWTTDALFRSLDVDLIIDKLIYLNNVRIIFFVTTEFALEPMPCVWLQTITQWTAR